MRSYVVIIVLLSISLVSAFIFTPRLSKLQSYKLYGTLNEQTDEEISTEEQEILINYLTNKFQDCRGDECRLDCDRNEIEALLKSILPPVTAKELKIEVHTLHHTLYTCSITNPYTTAMIITHEHIVLLILFIG